MPLYDGGTNKARRAEAISEITQTRFELLNNQITLDALRTDNLHQADQLISVLNLSVGERAC